MPKKVKHYLEDMTKQEQEALANSGFYRFARVHRVGKTWVARSGDMISQDRESIVARVREANQLAHDRGWRSPADDQEYFVWPT